MCRGAPARVARIEDDVAWVEQPDDAELLPVSLLGVEGVAVGDYLFHHAGLALTRLDPEDALDILNALVELDALYEAETPSTEAVGQ